MSALQRALRRECDDTDALLRHLGLDPKRCRTEGGWLNVPRIKTLLAEQPKPAVIDTADTVLHKPSGESWIVAFVQDGRLCACGWPLEFVPVEDCDLIEKATPESRAKLLRQMADISESDPRRTYARAAISGELLARLNGISATPRQPLSEAQIAAVLRKASERAGFVTLEAGEPSAFMVGVVRDVDAAHGITPAQGKGGE